MAGPARELLQQAAEGLAAAGAERRVPRRFAVAHLAALRAAAAVLAEHATPVPPVRAVSAPDRSRPTDAWSLLGSVAPELGEWADFFARCAPARRSGTAVTEREADDLVRQVRQFLCLAEKVVRGGGPRSRPGPAAATIEARMYA